MKIHEFAKELSHKLHRGQNRRDIGIPYTVHTDYVGDNVHQYYTPSVASNMDIARAVGYGHDIIEDCDVTQEWLEDQGLEEYGHDWFVVVHNIMLLTRVSKNTPILDYLKGIKGSIVAKAVKLTDLQHNMSDLNPGNLKDKYTLCQFFLET